MATELYPLLFEPVYQDYIWGGARIAEKYGRAIDMPVCAESWEISDRPEGMSVVSRGPLAGRSLNELVTELGTRLLGTDHAGAERFPLLIKLIDARQTLSVQVHPNDNNAALTGGEAKSEMWYILDGDADAAIYAGLTPGTDRASFEQALDRGTAADVLNRLDATRGEAVYIPGGLVHAIGAGCLILEIQQNSNTTYRVYDWGRVGHDGKPRPLHRREALQVMDWARETPGFEAPELLRRSGCNTWWNVVTSPYFITRRLDLEEDEAVSNDGRSFHALFVVAGRVTVSAETGSETLSAGTSCLLPADLAEYALRPEGPGTQLIVCATV